MRRIPEKPGFKTLRFIRTMSAARRGLTSLSMPPLEYHLEVTNRCNIRCRTCARLYDPKFKADGGTGDLPMEIFEKVKPWLRHSLRVNTVGFGEPFLHPNILDFMESCAAADNYITVITNGTVLRAPVISRIVDIGLDKLVVSMDGGTQSVFEKIRRGAKWEELLEALRGIKKKKEAARSKRPSITIEFVAMKGNFNTLPPLVEVVARLGASKLHIEPLIRGGNDFYHAFYAEQTLANLALDEVKSVYELTRKVAGSWSLGLTGGFVKAGADVAWNESRIWALGNLDHPCDGTPAREVETVSGWCLHPGGIDLVEVLSGGDVEASAKPSIERPDVVRSVSGSFPGKERCGFSIDVPRGRDGNAAPALVVVARDKSGGETVLGRFPGGGIGKSPAEARFRAGPSSSAQADSGSPEEADGFAGKPSCSPNHSPIKPPPQRRFGLPYCPEPWTTCFISFDGKVYPCCAAQGKPLGDLNTEDLLSIWNGKGYQALRRSISNGGVPDMCVHCVSNQRTLTKSIWAQFLPALLRRSRKIRAAP